MDVILKQDVEDLGQTGEVVHVAPGYARNYLFPRDLAVAATKGNLKNLHDFMASAEKKRTAERDEAQALADKISALDIRIEARAGERNRLFGSVTNQDIADFVNAAMDLAIDKKKVKVHGSIKMLGKHSVAITVYPGLVVEKEIDIVAATGASEVASAEVAPLPEEQGPSNDGMVREEVVGELTVAEEAIAEEINEETPREEA